MKLFSLKNFAMTGALSVAGLGLIGVGVHATFLQSTTSAQQITAGTMNVTLHSDSGNTVVSGDNTATLTLDPTNPAEGSSFMEAYHVVITNNSTIPVNEVSYQLSDTNNGNTNGPTMQAESWACLYAGSGSIGGNEGEVYFNSPLSTVIGWGAGASKFLTLAPLTTDDYTLIIYAGPTENTGCGTEYDGYTNSPFTLGGITTPGQYDGQIIGSYNPLYSGVNPWTPAFGVNPAANSLTTPAEGGAITPVLTIQYSG